MPVPHLTATITARGDESTVPDNAGAVDADIYDHGAPVGSVTLLPDFPSFNGGQLTTWGDCTEHWADAALISWAGDRLDDLTEEIIQAVRDADSADERERYS